MPSPRPFTLGDMMALVAATASGLALDRWRVANVNLPARAHRISLGILDWQQVLNYGSPSCWVIAFTLVLIPLRWIRPRVSVSRVLRQPGAVACLSILGTMALTSFKTISELAIHGWMRPPDDSIAFYSNQYLWSYCTGMIPVGVGGAWAALALGGRWSPERSWIDRAGIVVGLYWLIVYAFGFFPILIDLWFPYKR